MEGAALRACAIKASLSEEKDSGEKKIRSANSIVTFGVDMNFMMLSFSKSIQPKV